MNPVNLDETTQSWHADATLPPTLRARLSQAAPQQKRSRPTPALRYGLAACIGVGLGCGFVAYKNRPHQTQVQTLSQGTKSDKVLSDEMFQKVADTIKFWRESDVQATKKKQRYEAILFSDPECPSCKEVYPLLKKTTLLRLGICHVPMPGIRPHAPEWVNLIETGNDAKNFWRLMDGLQSGGGPPVGSRIYSKASQEASQRVAAMRAAAQAAGVTETPTLWVRARASADGEKPMQTWTARGTSGIKFMLGRIP